MPPYPPEMIARRTRGLIEEFGAGSKASNFLSSAFIPDAYCAVGAQNGFTVIRARSKTSFGYSVAIDIGARAIVRQIANSRRRSAGDRGANSGRQFD